MLLYNIINVIRQYFDTFEIYAYYSEI